MSTDLTKIPKEPSAESRKELSASERLRATIARLKGKEVVASGPEVALLLDRSGSMTGSPIRKLREAILPFGGMRRFQYSGETQELKVGETVQDPGARFGMGDREEGSNNEIRAFEALKASGVKHCIFVTDGGADDPPEALKAARGLKIDVIYIGPPPPPRFLKDLATATGGSYDGSITFAKDDGGKLLESKIRGLLPAPEEGKGKKVIAL